MANYESVKLEPELPKTAKELFKQLETVETNKWRFTCHGSNVKSRTNPNVQSFISGFDVDGDTKYILTTGNSLTCRIIGNYLEVVVRSHEVAFLDRLKLSDLF